MRHFLLMSAGGAALGLVLVSSGCDRQTTAGTQAAAPTVTVAYPIERVVTTYEDFTGRTAAIESVQITARVTGYLDKIDFREGLEVKEGSVLYEIDPRPYKAAFDQATAKVAQNQASLKLAAANRVRYEELFQKKVATSQDVETYRSQEAQSAATLAASQANLENARLNLEWTKVTAPIAGRMGQTLVSRGNLVTADRTELTTMVSLDPIYVYFDVDEATVQKIRQLIREGKIKPALPDEVTNPKGTDGVRGPLALAVDLLTHHADDMRQVFVGLGNETGNPHVAYVDFFNNQINLATATLQVRAILWNHKPHVGPRPFDPGLFVRVRVPTSPTFKALLVSQEAIGTNQNLKYIDVLGEDDIVVRRDVVLGGLQDGLQVVISGLQPKERVVITGLQHVYPGSKATPKLVPMPVTSPATESPTASPQVKAQSAKAQPANAQPAATKPDPQ